MTALTVNLNSIIELTDEQFYQLCQINRALRFERTATGELNDWEEVSKSTDFKERDG